jgi:hypothetical protein
MLASPPMQFGSWFPLEAAEPPQAPGVFQIRVESGLLGYPRGKSAMVAYGAGPELRTAVQELLRSAVGERARTYAPLLIRWVELAPGSDPAAVLARLRERFVLQFGSRPAAEE